MSVLIIEFYVNRKHDKLFIELSEKASNLFGGFNKGVDAMDFNRIDELEYEEVPIPNYIEDNNFNEMNKIKRKKWNNMFSGIGHVYKITSQGWQMSGMQYTFIPDKDGIMKEGIQDYYYYPYMICVPNGVNFNKDLAKIIIDKSLDKVYCEPDQYDAVATIKSTQNDYFTFWGEALSPNVSPELYMPFYNEKTGTDPIYDKNHFFTGKYWFGMDRIGKYSVLFAYQNGFVWRIEQKDGFNAETKDRVIYYSISFILLTFLLFLFLFYIKLSIRKTTAVVISF